jgi:hypothetical protein
MLMTHLEAISLDEIDAAFDELEKDMTKAESMTSRSRPGDLRMRAVSSRPIQTMATEPGQLVLNCA